MYTIQTKIDLTRQDKTITAGTKGRYATLEESIPTFETGMWWLLEESGYELVLLEGFKLPEAIHREDIQIL